MRLRRTRSLAPAVCPDHQTRLSTKLLTSRLCRVMRNAIACTSTRFGATATYPQILCPSLRRRRPSYRNVTPHMAGSNVCKSINRVQVGQVEGCLFPGRDNRPSPSPSVGTLPLSDLPVVTPSLVEGSLKSACSSSVHTTVATEVSLSRGYRNSPYDVGSVTCVTQNLESKHPRTVVILV